MSPWISPLWFGLLVGLMALVALAAVADATLLTLLAAFALVVTALAIDAQLAETRPEAAREHERWPHRATPY